MKKIFFLFAFTVLCLSQIINAKKILSHDDFDAWEKVTNNRISNNGEWAVFSVDPQEGDGVLTFYNTVNNKKIDVERGANPRFSADSKWGIALIKPFYSETRQAKIKNKTGFDLPQDSLAIIDLKTGKIEKIGNVISYDLGKNGGEWMAWLSCDTTYIEQSALDDKEAGRPLILRELTTGKTHRLNWIKDYIFSENGENLAVKMQKCKDDSLATNGIGLVMLPDTAFHIIDRDKVFYGSPVFNKKGNELAFVASNDSAKTGTKKCNLYLADLNSSFPSPKEIEMKFAGGGRLHLMKPNAKDPEKQAELEEEWAKRNNSRSGKDLFINQYSKPEFSENGKRLIIGVAPVIPPNDTTLVDFEKGSLDIWRWDAPFTPPQENNMVEELRKKTYPVVIDLSTGGQILMTDNPLVDVKAPDRWNADWALLEDVSKNIISLQWNYQFPVDILIKNVLTGEVKWVTEAPNEFYWLSPAGKYVAWYNDKNYWCYDIASGEIKMASEGVPYPLWKEDQDNPLPQKEPYGIMGWSDNDEALLVYDKYDVWSLDPKGDRAPFSLTEGEGRAKNLRFINIVTDSDFRSFNKGYEILYSVFDFENKYNGLATSEYGSKKRAPKIDFLEGNLFTQIRKGKDAQVYSWVKGNFSESPNVYFTRDINKLKSTRVTDSNPQLGDYRWGTAQLFKWYAYDGSPAEGVLYLPEDFNPEESYPMIAYFYEVNSDLLYYHYNMEPSWSWINFPFYVSRGYVIFVPDIHYAPGVPGESAWNYVCSGVEEVCRQFPNIDKSRIGIDGQSWGGYQTAYLVTRTNMFACAGSGAPVSNMTSAFGGIRWGTGDSRQAQYEMGQSRIGRNLWEAPALYMANSPLFYADRIETPLLIMHNDADGAVPWYQGIELFMALRRLGKPVWMLQYNSEAHNLKERRNRKDITKRLQQFFDHYLKGDPMPEWMKNGIPAVRKGQEYGFELTR